MSKYAHVVNKDKKRQLKLNMEILKDFLKDTDLKKLVAEFFVKWYEAGGFGKLKRDNMLGFNFEFGQYAFRLMRRPRSVNLAASRPTQNQVLRAVLSNNKKHIDSMVQFNKVLGKETDKQREGGKQR